MPATQSHRGPLKRMACLAGKYVRSQLQGGDQRALLLKAYDQALGHINAGDSAQAQATLLILIRSLDFAAEPSTAVGLMRLYRYCEAAIARDDLPEAARILAGLRDAWAMADIPRGVVRTDV